AADLHLQRALVTRQVVLDRADRVTDLLVGTVHVCEDERGVTLLAAQRRGRAQAPVRPARVDTADRGEAVGQLTAARGRRRAVDVTVGRGREEHDVRVPLTEFVGEDIGGPARL